jgi:hypothetical protein
VINECDLTIVRGDGDGFHAAFDAGAPSLVSSDVRPVADHRPTIRA